MASHWESQPWTAATDAFDVRAEASIPTPASIAIVVSNDIGETRSLNLVDGITNSVLDGFDTAEHTYKVRVKLHGDESDPTVRSPVLRELTLSYTDASSVPYTISVYRDDTGERLLAHKDKWTGGTDTVDVTVSDPDIRSDVYQAGGFGVEPYGEDYG